jgi:hypothetical protein
MKCFLRCRRSAKYVIMIPCNIDDEIDDSWVHTSHQQLKHEQSGLCIGKSNKVLEKVLLDDIFLLFQIVRIWIETTFMLPLVIPTRKLRSGNSKRKTKNKTFRLTVHHVLILLLKLVLLIFYCGRIRISYIITFPLRTRPRTKHFNSRNSNQRI